MGGAGSMKMFGWGMEIMVLTTMQHWKSGTETLSCVEGKWQSLLGCVLKQVMEWNASGSLWASVSQTAHFVESETEIWEQNLVRLFKRHLSSKRGLASTEMLKSRNPAIQIPGAKTASAHMVFILRKKLKFLLQRCWEIMRSTAITWTNFATPKNKKKSAPNLSVILNKY